MSRVKVAVCVQPLDAAEGNDAASDSSRPSASGCAVQALGSGRLAVSDASTWNTEEFAFDHVYGAFERTKGGVDMTADAAAHRHTRARLFADVGVPALDAAWRGHNVGVFAVGHSDAGARHAMRGDEPSLEPSLNAARAADGLLPRFVDALFGRVEKEREMASGAVTRVDASFVEVRGDRARDLCARETGSASIVTTTAPTRVRVDSADAMRRVLRGALERSATMGNQSRLWVPPGVGASDGAPLGDDPSRRAPDASVTTHFVARITLTRFLRRVPAKSLAATRAGALEAARDAPLVSEVTLVELCGFERAGADDSLRELVEAARSAANGGGSVRQTETETETTRSRDESGASSRNQNQRRVVTKKQAPLWRLARRCAPGGDATIWLVAAVSPRDADTDATLATLRFASTFRNVRCVSRRNVDPDAERFVEAEGEARAVAGEVERLAKALAAARARRAEAPVKRASFGRRATEPSPAPNEAGAESEADETDRLRQSLRDVRAAQETAERRRRAARAKWTAKLERYAGARGKPSWRGDSFGDARRSAAETAANDDDDGDDALAALAADPPRSSAPATLTPLCRVARVPRDERERGAETPMRDDDPISPPPPTIAVPTEPGGRVRVGSGLDFFRDGVDVALAGFGVRPTHAVVLRGASSADADAVFVAAGDGDAEADVWVNGARVPSLEESRATNGPKLTRLRDGDRVVIGARSGAVYTFRDPNDPNARATATATGRTGRTGDVDRDDDVGSTLIDPWLEARLELKPLAATLARALAGAPSPPDSLFFHPDRTRGSERSSPVRSDGERRRRWREVSRANLARVLPDVDEFNARCRAMGVWARVAPAWDAVPRGGERAEGASVSVVARATRGLSARAVVELEASAIDDVTNVAATWSAADFSRTRLAKLRAFHERAPDERRGRIFSGEAEDASPRVLAPSWEEDEEDPFLTFASDGGSVALRFADVAPDAWTTHRRDGGDDPASRTPRTPSGAQGSRPASGASAPRDRTPAKLERFAGGTSLASAGDDVLVAASGERSDERASRASRDSRDSRAGSEASAAASAETPAAADGEEDDARETIARRGLERLEPETSDPETTAGLFRALAAERSTIASLERRLDVAEARARAADVAATRAEASRAAAEARADAAAASAEARVAEARARLGEATATRAAEKDSAAKEKETLRATIATLEGDLEAFRTPTPAEKHAEVPGLAPFAFPRVPPALEKKVPGENSKRAAEQLRELVREFRRAARAAEVTLEYANGCLARVRAECAQARADKADEIARRVAAEYALEARSAAAAASRARAEKAERLLDETRDRARTNDSWVSKARARLAVTTNDRSTNDRSRNGGIATTNEEDGRSEDPRRARVPALNLNLPALLAKKGFAEDAENAPPREDASPDAAPDWAKRATPLLRGLDPTATVASLEAAASREGRVVGSRGRERSLARGSESPSRKREDARFEDAVRVPAALRELTDLAMSLPLSARQPEAEAPSPRGEVASRVKAKLGGRERLRARAGSAASAGRSLDLSPPSRAADEKEEDAFSFSSPSPRGFRVSPGAREADAEEGDASASAARSLVAGFDFVASPPLPLSRPRDGAGGSAREWWETDLAGNDTKTPSPVSRATDPSMTVPIPPSWRSPPEPTGNPAATAEKAESEPSPDSDAVPAKETDARRASSARLRPPATPEDVGAFGAVSQEERRAWWAKRQLKGAVAKIGAVRAFKAAGARRGNARD